MQPSDDNNELVDEEKPILRRLLRHLAIMGILFVAVLVFFLLYSGSATADTRVTGDVTTDTTWTQPMSPIWVESWVTVRNGATLTIDPGVSVRFNGDYYLRVQDGALVANGDAGGAGIITFTSNYTTPFPGAWDGIIFQGNLGTSLLDYVVISYASTGITFEGPSVPVTNTQVMYSQWYGIYISSSTTPYDLVFSGGTITNAGSYGVYIATQTNNHLTLRILGSTFSNYGTAAVFVSWFQYANFSLTLDGNSFNASNRVLYFGNNAYGDPAEGNYYRVTFTNNWVNSSSDSYAIYNPYDVLDFKETNLVFTGNQFVGRGSRTYGIYLDDFRGQTGYDQSFTLQVANNEFTDLTYTGVWFDLIYDFRHVTLDFTGNIFKNTDAITMDYGIFGNWGPYYSLDSYDSSFTLRVDGNTALDLSGTAVYMWPGTSDGYRDVTISVTGNDFRNTRDTAYMDYGVYLQAFRWDGASPSSLTLTVSGNTIRDLDDYAVYVNSFSGFRTVSVEATGNLFENVVGAWMDYGLYLPNGIDSATTLTFTFRDNQATALNNYALYASSFDGASLATSRGSFIVSGNTIKESAYGLYLGSISDYDLSGSLIVENNVLTNVTNAGIFLGWHDTTNSRVIIRSNTVTGPVTGSGPSGIVLQGFQYQSAKVDILSNTVRRAVVGIEVDWPAYGSGDTVLTIQNNQLTDIVNYGLFINEVYRASAFVNISGNTVKAKADASNTASLIYFAQGSNGWYRAFVDLDMAGNVLEGGLHGIYFYGTNGAGATVIADIQGVTSLGTAFGVTLDYPVTHPADILNLRIRDSTFTDNHRGFLSINQAGMGLLPINITGVQAINFGDWGGYGIFIGNNFGGVVRIDVRSSDFQDATGSLGDVYAGFGPVTMNFYFIDSITSGEAKDTRQIIRVLWMTDVQVLKGKNLNVPAAGVQVHAEDQYGTRSFISVTDSSGWVRDQYVSGFVIGYRNGESYAGPAIQNIMATWGPFNGTAVATFSGNGQVVTVYLPGDADGDGINDLADPDDDNDGIPDERDENPLSAGFLDFRAPPYNLHLWVLMGLIGAIVVPLAVRLWRTGPPLRQKREPEEWTPAEPPQEPQ